MPLEFNIVKLGNQEWTKRNLEVDRFRNGELITHIESAEEWTKAGVEGQPAWCYYDNDPENGKKYGKLYNWYAVNDPRGLAPEGWHIPTDEEWTGLQEYLGDYAGYKMKSEVEWAYWVDEDDEDGLLQSGNGNNSSGFNALPGGYRASEGSFNVILHYTFFWSASENGSEKAWFRYLSSVNSFEYHINDNIGFYPKSVGLSIRCLRD
jgi:uncharacterized protein (TIGR02145 family)